MEKENVVHIPTGVHAGHKTEQNSVSDDRMAEHKARHRKTNTHVILPHAPRASVENVTSGGLEAPILACIEEEPGGVYGTSERQSGEPGDVRDRERAR